MTTTKYAADKSVDMLREGALLAGTISLSTLKSINIVIWRCTTFESIQVSLYVLVRTTDVSLPVEVALVATTSTP